MAEQVRPAMQMPDPEIIKSYRGKWVAAKETADESKDDLKQVLEEAESVGIHKPAFKLGCKLAAMDIIKAQDFLRNLTHIVKALGLDSQRDLFEPNLTTPVDETDPDKRVENAEAQGYEAGKTGMNFDANPYDVESPEAPYWAEGWRRGQNEIAAEITTAAPSPKPGPRRLASVG